ncbi:MAG: D-alanine--D-alanine ligase [Gammaproteobacteria bacterium]|nr:D-alanine--D-alanine ligase [Gammaproteobacteria bacterium]
MNTDSKIKTADSFGRVAVAMGGVSAERDISLKSGNAVLSALLEQGVKAIAVDIGNDPVSALRAGQFDRVFNIVHGRGGEDGILQGVMESLGLPYTGSGVLGSALSMDKHKTKLCWQASQLPTPSCMVLEDQEDLGRVADQLGFPVIVKPVREGSSLGMSKVNSVQQLEQAWHQAQIFDNKVIAEQWVSGNEYTVAVLDNNALPIIGLQTPNEFYDYQAKYIASTTQYHCPSGLSEIQESTLQNLALKACQTVEVSGWCRVDLFVDETDRPWLIEVNTVPGMTDHSLVPMAAKAAGIDFNELVFRILETSVEKENDVEKAV